MKPMNLKDLPNYINELRKNNSFDESLVVDVGNITDKPHRRVNSKIILSAISLMIVLVFITAYNLGQSDKNTIILTVEANDVQAVSEIMSDVGAKVISVKQKEEDNFEVSLNRPKDMNSFLEKLKNHKNMKKVEVKN